MPLPSVRCRPWAETLRQADASISVRPPKMLSDNSGLTSAWFQKFAHELGKHRAGLQPIAVFVKVVGPRSGRRASLDEPAVQEIVVELLHELVFRPDAVEHLKQQRTRTARRESRAAFARVSLSEATRQLASTSRTSRRIFLSGWSAGTRASARCTKTARPDLQTCPACQPPPIRDRKSNDGTPAMARFFSRLLEKF